MSLNGGLRLRVLVRSVPGAGKTYLSATFPKFYNIVTVPGEEDTWMVRPELKKNCAKVVYATAESPQDTKRMFTELATQLQEAKKLAREGTVETLIVDNLTHLVEQRWMYINQYEKVMSRSGEVDTRGMYGSLNRWCRQFVSMDLLTFPGHLVVTCHEQVEEDDKMEKLPDKSSPIVPTILGGFRDDISSYFSLDLSLEKKQLGDKYQYLARSNKGGQRNSKSRYPLPPQIENISYQAICDAIEKAQAGVTATH